MNDVRPTDADDRYLWLEDVQGADSLAWVEAQNARALAALAGPDFERDRETFRAILSASDKIPFVLKRGPFLYNLWQDKDNPRGLWRRTTVESYRSPVTEWDVLIDVDALGREEDENWVWHGCMTLPPDHRRGLVVLSRGGADASVVREFDLEKREFVADGFVLPEAKSSVSWGDADILYVASPLGDGHTTTSGYARTVRRWRRSTPFEDAEVIFEGSESDVSVYASVDHERGFERAFVGRRFSFFDAKVFQLSTGGLRSVDVPTDAFWDAHREWLTVRLRSPWKPKDREFRTDSLIAIRFDAFMAGNRDFDLLFEPSERCTINNYSWARNRLAISVLDNVRTNILMAEPSATGWTFAPLPDVTETETANIWCMGDEGGESSEDFLLMRESFLEPTSLSLITPGKGPQLLKQLPPRFDASGLSVMQHEAVADDGVRIPYFQVSPKNLPLDGSTPTILYGYGGFLVSLLPTYSMGMGKAWLEHGLLRRRRCLGRRQHSRRRRVRRYLAQSGHPRAQEARAGRLRHCGSRSRSTGSHEPATARLLRRQQRWTPCRQHAHALSGALWRGLVRHSAARHAPLQQAPRRRELDRRIRRSGQAGRLGIPQGDLALPTRQEGEAISDNSAMDIGPR